MLILRIYIELITVLFLMGLIGTVFVLLLTGLEDFRTIFVPAETTKSTRQKEVAGAEPATAIW